MKPLYRIPVETILVALLLTGPAPLFPPSVAAETPDTGIVAPFSQAPEGSAVPPGWEAMTFPKIPRHTRYETVKDEGIVVVRAESEAAASGLVRKVSVDLREYPVIAWRWKIEDVIAESDVRSKEGDDYAARLYITFEYDPDKVSFSKKTKYWLGRMVYGELPIGAVNYIWAAKDPVGTRVNSVYTDFSNMVVVQSGREKTGRWISESRNLYEDYKAAFGEEPPRVNAVAVMTDTDNSGTKAVAYYGDIEFKKSP